MSADKRKNADLTGRTFLIAPSAPRELVTGLEQQGGRVITWPEIEIGEAENYAALDEAIENLFGYDWLLFLNVNAVEFFLRRFHQLGREVSELDQLRVCAIGEPAITRLEASQVHIDLTPDSPQTETVLAAIESYAGGREAMARLNFLVPRASLRHEGLCELLEDAGARVDVVIAYRTVAANSSALTQLNALLAGGGIDCVVLTGPETVEDLALLMDTNDLHRIIGDVAVASVGEAAAQSAVTLGLRSDLPSTEHTMTSLLRTIVERFGSGAR
jgi:uroporphyrinogen-III synthase